MSSGRDIARTLGELKAGLISAGFASIDYAELRNADTLAPITLVGAEQARLFVAARIGATRLIDNIPL